MIRLNTVFDILDWQIIRLFYKKKYSVKIRVIRLVCVLITRVGARLCLAPSILTGSTCRDSCNKVEPCRNKGIIPVFLCSFFR